MLQRRSYIWFRYHLEEIENCVDFLSVLRMGGELDRIQISGLIDAATFGCPY